MHDIDGERLNELCRQASVELDREKLLQLIGEINRLLEEKQRHSDELSQNPKTSTGLISRPI